MEDFEIVKFLQFEARRLLRENMRWIKSMAVLALPLARILLAEPVPCVGADFGLDQTQSYRAFHDAEGIFGTFLYAVIDCPRAVKGLG